MARKTRAELKAFFERGDKPTEQQFSDLVDSLYPEQAQVNAGGDFQITKDDPVAFGLSYEAPFAGKMKVEVQVSLTFDTAAPSIVHMWLQKGDDVIAESDRYISNASPTTLGQDYREGVITLLIDVAPGDIITVWGQEMVTDIACQSPKRYMICTTTPA